MAASIPTTEPAALVAGDTAKWQRTLADYPASEGWTLRYTLTNALERYTFDASASGNDYLVTVAANTTANWQPGVYAWRAQVLKAAEVFTMATGSITVSAQWGAATDARSSSRIALDNVNAYLADAKNLAASQYRIGERELARWKMTDLLALRSRLQAEVAREEAGQAAAAGLADKRRVLVEFR
jgi:predicted extracellular nuclease